jgi:hypothetical protein
MELATRGANQLIPLLVKPMVRGGAAVAPQTAERNARRATTEYDAPRHEVQVSSDREPVLAKLAHAFGMPRRKRR